jgi:hypothetical protein
MPRLAALAAVLAVLLAGCGGPGTPRAPQASVDAAIEAAVAVREPGLWTLADLKVSFADGAPLLWYETTYRTEAQVEERVAATLRIALAQAASGLLVGGRHVRIEARVRAFRGLTRAEAYGRGGAIGIVLDLAVADAVTGRVLAARTGLEIAGDLPGGVVLLAAQGSQRSLITLLVRDAVRAWLRSGAA